MSSTKPSLKNSGIIPTSGLEYWHPCVIGESGDNVAYDYSGNSRTLTAGATSPVIQSDVLNGRPGWYFDGADDPLVTTAGPAINLKHFFIVASFEDAAFAGNEGLLSGETDGPVLVGGGAAATKFFDFNYDSVPTYTYYKNATSHAETDLQAPVGGNFGLLEISHTAGIPLTGFQIGQDRADTTRKWKGWFMESMAFNRVLTATELNAVRLYFNLKFATNTLGVPLYFPSDDYLDFRRTRFYESPEDFDAITDSYEFEDAGQTFNEVAPNAPKRWEYEYRIARDTVEEAESDALIFDEFWNRARRSNKFYFLDKYGETWDNVQIESYSRTHAEHKPWDQSVRFELVRYPQ